MNLNNINTFGNDYLTNSVILNVDELNTATIANDEFNQLLGIRTDITIQDQIDGITSGTGIVGPAGPTGSAGPSGVSFIWKGEYSSSTIYHPNDCVQYNGSSYICRHTCLNLYPSDDSTGYFWDLLAEKGEKGDKGDKGSKGDDGKDGKDGKDGADGADGGGVDVAGIVGVVLAAVDMAATTAAIVAIQAELAAIETQLLAVEADQATVQTKVLYQSTLNPATDGMNATRFTSELRVNDGFLDTIILNPYGENEINNKTTINDDLTVGGHTQLNTLNISHNVASGLLFGPTDSFTPNASITHSPPIIPADGVDNQGFLNMDAGTVNIGTVANLTTVNLKGASVNLTGAVNVYGSLSLNGVPIIPNGLQTNGFFNQWV